MANYRRRTQDDTMLSNDAKGVAQPDIAELMRQLGELGGKVSTLQENMSFQRAQAPAPQPPSIVPTPPKLSLDNLPDPVSQKEAYAEEIVRRTLNFANEQSVYNTQVSELAKPKPIGNVDALWDDFLEAHSEYAEDDSKFRFALGETAKRLGNRGVDFGKYLFTDTDRAFAAIMETYDRTFGTPEVFEPDDTQDPDDTIPPQVQAQRKQAKRGDDDGDDGRTDGIPGGGDRQGIPQVDRMPAGDMLKEMRDLQIKSGYF